MSAPGGRGHTHRHRLAPLNPMLGLTDAHRRDIRRAFDLFDQAGHGVIDVSARRCRTSMLASEEAIFTTLIVSTGEEMTDEELAEMISSADLDEDGLVREEILSMMELEAGTL